MPLVVNTPSYEISVLLPAYNEAENLSPVITEIKKALLPTKKSFEIVVVDDGSSDNTTGVLEMLTEEFPFVRSVQLRRNFGKSKALNIGFQHCHGQVIILMDADGQDDPNEIPLLLNRLDEGYDLVTGRRSDRNDRFIKRNTSKIYNATTSRVSGVAGKDFNSGFKAMRKEVAQQLALYGELHRYIPVLATWKGFRCSEVTVNHRARLHGSSKFGTARFWRGMLDLVTVKFLTTYMRRPFHLIGGSGIVALLLGGVLLTWMLILRIMGETVGSRPALLAGVVLVLAGLQLVIAGLIAELIVRISPHSNDLDAVAFDNKTKTGISFDASQPIWDNYDTVLTLDETPATATLQEKPLQDKPLEV